jgi:hypothetical protein
MTIPSFRFEHGLTPARQGAASAAIARQSACANVRRARRIFGIRKQASARSSVTAAFTTARAPASLTDGRPVNRFHSRALHDASIDACRRAERITT